MSCALSCLEKLGFKTHIGDPVWLAKAARGEYFVDLITALGNAVMIVDKSWLDRAEPNTILDVSRPVLAAEEMIASKIFVSRRERAPTLLISSAPAVAAWTGIVFSNF